MAKISSDINTAKNILNNGDVVAIPTETVYGLAGNAFDERVVKKIFSIKDRPNYDPLIVHTDTIDKVIDFVIDIPDKIYKLAKKFWPGPLTILLNKNNKIPNIVTSNLKTVGVRIPDNQITKKLLSSLNYPLAAPSANPFGYISPTNPFHVNDQLGSKIPFILDGGDCSFGIESTIIGIEKDLIHIYRYGCISVEDIEEVVGKVKIAVKGSNPKAPGMVDIHYAPIKPLFLGNTQSLIDKYSEKSIALIRYHEKINDNRITKQYILSKDKNIYEAGKNLFNILRLVDKLNVDIIIAEKLPDLGMGKAINDRLYRASTKNIV